MDAERAAIKVIASNVCCWQAARLWILTQGTCWQAACCRCGGRLRGATRAASVRGRWCGGRTLHRQSSDAGGGEWRAWRCGWPVEQELRRTAANASLAGTHAAAGRQLGGAPMVKRLHVGIGHVLAATQQGVGGGELLSAGRSAKWRFSASAKAFQRWRSGQSAWAAGRWSLAA